MKPETVLQGLVLISSFFVFSSELAAQCTDLKINLGKDTSICENTSLILDAGEADTYLWNDGSTERFLNVTEAGTYIVQATNTCSDDRDTIIIEILDSRILKS